MLWVKQRYHDVSPVTLQVVGGAMSSSLYCGEVEGLSLVESFLVELYRCKLCQFTCGLRSAIHSHLLLRHRPPPLACLAGDEGASPYRLELNGEAKQSDDDDEDFLLYNMLENMSPPTCDITNQEGLQVAHTCEVSTLFEEEEQTANSSSLFPLKEDDALDLSAPIDPASVKEEMDQSAHLMTLGLCRISSVKAPPPAASLPAGPAPLRQEADPQLLCLLCPLTLPSRRLLDVHVRSHRDDGSFGCIRCAWTSGSWEDLESHWRDRCGKRRRDKKVSHRKRKSRRQQEASQRSQKQKVSRRTASRSSDQWRRRLIGRAEGKKAELPDRSVTGEPPAQNVSEEAEKSRRTTKPESLSCLLCHRKFSSKLTLKRHLGVHGGEKPFTCSHCPYRTRLKASLQQHLRTHTGEKPYRCTECSYASIDRSSLLRHSRSHSQEKPYRCHLCNYSSIQKKCLDLHARRHHTGEAFPCQQCEYSTPDRRLLLRHVKRNHAPSQQAGL